MKKFFQGIIWFAVFILLFWFGTCWGDSIGYERGFAAGKKDNSTSVISGCSDYDSAQCEMMRDSI